MDLSNLGSSIGNFFSGLGSAVNNATSQTFHYDYQQPQIPTAQAAAPHPLFSQTPMPSPAQAPNISPQSIQQGLQRAGFGSAPVATMSADFARAGQQMPPSGDQYMPLIMSLMETGGGAHQVGQNNMVNIRGTQSGQSQFINYPNPQTALFGGNNGGVPSAGFVGMINHSNPSQADYYNQYRQTGNLADFFNHYTPQGEGNPSLDQLMARYNALRSNFR